MGVAVLMIACDAGAQEETAAPLTLDQCITIALSDNPTVRVADMEITKADYSRRGKGARD